ncbi:hypothetical protein L249_4211 [Ophiocordyceps polyrhachis-furcata BCC 54312]|uniref:Uncharacterized protein n=1 Tax=Ophiocordyceps polyrhachis-furcata BCC 54312 TaxID=1330021 RepID=A0A367LBW6_9HYPO|nr:hypothetical protein L249_4211 [Ophiocordyceps polyrhachis-furcata BCC 54312]
MSRRWCFETTPSGREQIISVKRYRHHHHHHHQHRRPHQADDKAKKEWDRLVDRERCLAEANKRLTDEVCALKTSLTNAQAEGQHLSQVVVVQLQNQMDGLAAENAALRQSVDCAAKRCPELEEMAKRLQRERDCLEKSRIEADKAYALLERENADLGQKIKCLSRRADAPPPPPPPCDDRLRPLLRDAEYWKGKSQYWKDRYDDAARRLDDSCGILEIRTRKMRAYEEILRRRRFI